MTLLLAGCSSVPDAVNPMEWYRGAEEAMTGRKASAEARAAEERAVESRDYPDNRDIPDRPQVLSPEERQDIAEGLVADRANAKYTQEEIDRDGTPTRPLSARATQPTAPTVSASVASAAAPGPAPASEMAAEAMPAPRRDPPVVRSAEAAPAPPAAPRREVAAAPAAKPAAPAAKAPVVAPVVAKAPSEVETAYRRRLAESAAGTSSAAPRATPAPQPASMATPQVKFVVVDFAPNKTLVPDAAIDQIAALAEAATRGKRRVKVLGSAVIRSNVPGSLIQALDLAMRRADAVALILRKAGVPADRITIATGGVGDRAEAVLE